MKNKVVRTGRERRVVQMPIRVLRQCLRFALYLFKISVSDHYQSRESLVSSICSVRLEARLWIC
jgi:hypothetical protein